jgi:uncharacterized DUF497 family protein
MGVEKDLENQAKHGVSFAQAQYAFADPRRVIAEDLSHSQTEQRYYCFGAVEGGILTVRFTIPSGDHPHLRRRLLAERQANL